MLDLIRFIIGIAPPTVASYPIDTLFLSALSIILSYATTKGPLLDVTTFILI